MKYISDEYLLSGKSKHMVGGYAYDLLKCLVVDAPGADVVDRKVVEDIRAKVASKIEPGQFFDYKDEKSMAYGDVLEIIDSYIGEEK